MSRSAKAKPTKPVPAEPSPPPAPPDPAPAAPQKPAPLTDQTLDLILAADLANIVKKVKAGKPLSTSERAILEARKQQRNGENPATPPERSNDYHIPTLLEALQAELPEPVKDGRGRPRFKIDFTAVARMASIQCTVEEIAAILGCSKDTLERSPRFCGIYKKNFERGKMSLRRHQWRAVEVDRNPTMMIWLGKQYLGQKDRHEVSATRPTDANDLTREQLKSLPTSELRRLLGPPTSANIIDIEATPVKGNGSNGNGANGKH